MAVGKRDSTFRLMKVILFVGIVKVRTQEPPRRTPFIRNFQPCILRSRWDIIDVEERGTRERVLESGTE